MISTCGSPVAKLKTYNSPIGLKASNTADCTNFQTAFEEGRIKLYGTTIKMAVAMPKVKFRSETVAITNALAARQSDLRIVPSCSTEGRLLIHNTHKMTVDRAITDEVEYCIVIACAMIGVNSSRPVLSGHLLTSVSENWLKYFHPNEGCIKLNIAMPATWVMVSTVNANEMCLFPSEYAVVTSVFSGSMGLVPK